MATAKRVIDKMGGIQATADIVGASHSWVARWTYDRARGGTGGMIPAKYQQPLLNAAKERGIDLTPADFFDVDGA